MMEFALGFVVGFASAFGLLALIIWLVTLTDEDPHPDTYPPHKQP